MAHDSRRSAVFRIDMECSRLCMPTQIDAVQGLGLAPLLVELEEFMLKYANSWMQFGRIPKDRRKARRSITEINQTVVDDIQMVLTVTMPYEAPDLDQQEFERQALLAFLIPRLAERKFTYRWQLRVCYVPGTVTDIEPDGTISATWPFADEHTTTMSMAELAALAQV
jgi:hypothetical protein